LRLACERADKAPAPTSSSDEEPVAPRPPAAPPVAPAFDCATQCEAYAGFETQCAGLTVSLEPVTIVAGGGYSCRCL